MFYDLPTPRRQHQRGFSLLVATGFMAAMSVAALVSFSVVRNQAEVSGQQRREREAHFAALAGLAEARGLLTTLLPANSTRYTPLLQGAMAGLTRIVPGVPVFAGVPLVSIPNPLSFEPSVSANMAWYMLDALPPLQPYNLTASAVDPFVTKAGTETIAPDGQKIQLYPDQRNVRFSVFLVDNDDGDGQWDSDSDGRVWLVSVGQVTAAQAGAMPTQVVVRALVTNNNNNESCLRNTIGESNNWSDCNRGVGTGGPVLVTVY